MENTIPLQPITAESKAIDKVNVEFTSTTSLNQTCSGCSDSEASRSFQEGKNIEHGVPEATSSQTIAPTPPRKRTALHNQCISFNDFLRLVVFTAYRQLWTIVVGANLVGLIFLVVHEANADLPPRLDNMATGAIANIAIAILIRQDYIKNSVFYVCWSTPHSAPLWLRKKLAKVYELGGVHSGGAVAGVAWFLIFAAFLTREYARRSFHDIAVLTLVYALLAIFLAVLVGAIPAVRRAHHNWFENLHRLGGWSAILLFWPTLVLFVRSSQPSSSPFPSTLARALSKSPAFWLLILLTLHTLYPWLFLRRVLITKTELLSNRAIRIYFSPCEHIPPLRGILISDSPLREWHSFASVPDTSPPSENNASSCIISRAGDWTSKILAHPPSHFWMRGAVHQTGTLAMAGIFRSAIIVTTGSGIGPCLAVFNHLPHTRVRVIWSSPNPRGMFGDKVCARVRMQDPRAVVWDTREPGRGRPDLMAMAAEMFEEEGAEAVFMISNRALTKEFVEGLRRRGVPAFAPVFDS